MGENLPGWFGTKNSNTPNANKNPPPPLLKNWNEKDLVSTVSIGTSIAQVEMDRLCRRFSVGLWPYRQKKWLDKVEA